MLDGIEMCNLILMEYFVQEPPSMGLTKHSFDPTILY